jgi:hypothetical protein
LLEKPADGEVASAEESLPCLVVFIEINLGFELTAHQSFSNLTESRVYSFWFEDKDETLAQVAGRDFVL